MDHLNTSKNVKAILEAVRSLGNAEVARILGCSEPTVSELSAERGKYKFNFHKAAELLAHAGLAIRPAHFRCYNPEDIDRIMFFARKGMQSMNPDSLEWGDE